MNLSVKKVTVKYASRTVGYLVDVGEGKISFQYDEEWVKNGFPISPFSLPLASNIYTNSKDTFEGLYGVFSDSLPDGWGRLLMARYLQKEGVDYLKLSPLTKLSLVGANGLGGLSYEPTQSTFNEKVGYSLDKFASSVQALLKEQAVENETFDEMRALGGASGGARPKLHVKILDKEVIVKYPCQIDPVDIGEKEYKANKLARECGINTADFILCPSEVCSGYFASVRFDRVDGKKIHTVSLSSLLETTHRVPNLDYMHLFQVVKAISVCKDDLIEAYKRCCFNVLYGNRDDHGKNFSFVYDESLSGYRLSPHYDITETPFKPEHEMTVLGNGKPTEKDLLAIGKEIKLPQSQCKKIIEMVKYVLENEK